MNKNAIPFDPRSPKITSGIRVCSPALTTRGMKEKEMEAVAELMHQALTHSKDPARLKQLEAQVLEFGRNFPLFAKEWIV